MKRLTAWSVPALLLLIVVGCSKDDTNVTGPVANDQQQKVVQASPKIYWEPWQYPDAAHMKPYVKSYPAPASKSALKSVAATPPIVANGDFETGSFSPWTTYLNNAGMVDYTTATYHTEWAWIVDDFDPRGTNTAIYPFGMLHPEPLAHSGDYGASAVENIGGVDHRMYQTDTLPLGGTLTLEFWVRWKNLYPGSPKWFNNAQDLVVTLRNPATDAILATLFKASTIQPPPFSGGGNVTTANYEQRTADVTAFAGQTVRLDFATYAHATALFVDFDDIAIVQVLTNQPPVANAGPDQTVECTSHSGASVTLDGSGSSDPDNDPLTYAWTWTGGTASGATPTVTLPLGSHEVTLTVDDGKGGTATDVVVVNVVDTTPPVVTLNGASEVTLECPAPYVELEAVVTDVCDPTPSLEITGSVDSHTVGEYTITYTGKDASGNTTVVTRTVKVVDTTPPVISSVTATPNSLWPPNHKLVAVTIGVNASDNCGSVTSAIVGVTSSEADNGIGDGNTTNDIQNINGLSVDLRAERSGKGGGRIYTITVRCTDPSGNYAEKTMEVIVPGDNGKKR